MRGIDLEDNKSLQRKEWLTQRVGWVLWSAILFAGCLGLLGSGPLSSARNTDSDGTFSVEYNRFLHYHHPTELRVLISDSLAAGRELEVKLTQGLLNRVQIKRIEPEPMRASLVGNGVVYTFSRLDSANSSEIVFHLDFERIGQSRGIIEVDGKVPIVLSQFVYP